MNRKLAYTLLSVSFFSSAMANVMPTQDKMVNRLFPDEPGFQSDTEYKKKFEEMKAQLDKLQETSQKAQETLTAASKDSEVSTQHTPSLESLNGQKNDPIFSEKVAKPVFISPKPKGVLGALKRKLSV